MLGLEPIEAGRLVIERNLLSLGGRFIKRRDRGGAGLDGDLDTRQVAHAGDLVLVIPYEHCLTGGVIGAGIVDLLSALGGDRVGGNHGLHAAVLERGLTGVRCDLCDVQQRTGIIAPDDVAGQGLGDGGVEPGDLAGGRILRGEDRRGLRPAGLEHARLLDGRGPGGGGDDVVGGHGAGVDDRVVVDGARTGRGGRGGDGPAVGTRVGAGGQDGGEGGRTCGAEEQASVGSRHGCVLSWWRGGAAGGRRRGGRAVSG